MRCISLYGQELLVVNDECSDLFVARFLAKVKFEDEPGCWLWIGSTDGADYGRAYSLSKKSEGAHRISYSIFVGPIEEGLQIHHICENPSCVNPSHLQAVTPLEHLELTPQAITNLQKAQTHCINGHELIGDNLYVYPGLAKKRRCRTCFNAWQNKRLAQKSQRAIKPERVSCNKGHILDESNTYLYMGAKMCKACHNDVTLRRYHEKRTSVEGCTNGHPYSEFGDFRVGGKRFCRECERLLSEKNSRKVVDGVSVCKNGHPMEGDNVYRSVRRGKHIVTCNVCHKESQRKTYQKRKEKYRTVS